MPEPSVFASVWAEVMYFRRKRGDTKVATVERAYGVDFGVRSDMKLSTLLERTGASSMTEAVEFARNGKLEPWRNAERAACARRGIPHVGGSGRPDCDGGDHIVEVKAQARPVSGAQIVEIAAKPWAQGKQLEIVSGSGFTADAREVARTFGVRLRKS